MERKNAWNTYEEEDLIQVNRIAEQYRQFISDCKTERECAARIREMAEAAGYVSLEKRCGRKEACSRGIRSMRFIKRNW